jgi:hypothetical protein
MARQMGMRGGIAVETPVPERNALAAPRAGGPDPWWAPFEGACVSVVDYPSPLPFGVVTAIERGEDGEPTTYWVWMLDDCRIALEAHTASSRLKPHDCADQ